MSTLELENYGKIHNMSFMVGQYGNGNLAIQMVCFDEGYPEVWSTLTVNLCKVKKSHGFVDSNNNGESICQWIIDNKLGEPTGEVYRSGYCTYPEFKFNMEQISKFTYK